MINVNRSQAACLLPSLLGALTIGATTVTACAQTTTPTAPVSPAVVGATPDVPAITFSAMFDGYYEYDFNKVTIPAGGSSANTIGPFSKLVGSSSPTGRAYDSTNNAFTLGLAEVGVSKATTDASRLGFTVKLGYGPTASDIASAGDASTVNILEAYGTFLIPVGTRDLTVDAGKYLAHMSYETVEPELNYNYSHSDLYQFFVPIYAAGVSASYPFTPTLTGTGYVENGWNSATHDSNVAKAYGFSLAFTPSSKWSLVVRGLTSVEAYEGTLVTTTPDSDDGDEETSTTTGVYNGVKNLVGPTLTYNFSPAFSATVDADFDFGKGLSPDNMTDVNGSWSASGVAGYLHYAMSSGSSITLRGETFDDKDGFLTGNDGEKGSEITVTYGIKSPMFPGAETRFEYRYDSMKDKAGDTDFFYGGTTGKKTQSTLGISELLSF